MTRSFFPVGNMDASKYVGAGVHFFAGTRCGRSCEEKAVA